MILLCSREGRLAGPQTGWRSASWAPPASPPCSPGKGSSSRSMLRSTGADTFPRGKSRVDSSL